MPDQTQHLLDALEAEFASATRAEQFAKAIDLEREAARCRTFNQAVRELPAGEVVELATSDGAVLRGRVLEVGPDRIRLAETAGTRDAHLRARAVKVHDVRTGAVVRLSTRPGRV